MRAIEICQSGSDSTSHIENATARQTRASIGSCKFWDKRSRLAADDEHRLIGRSRAGATNQKNSKTPPRQRVVTEKQFAEILSKLPVWAVAPIKAINITSWRVRAVLSRRKMNVDLERGFSHLGSRVIEESHFLQVAIVLGLGRPRSRSGRANCLGGTKTAAGDCVVVSPRRSADFLTAHSMTHGAKLRRPRAFPES